MRIWDISPKYLCHKHLIAEHRELHGLWNILTKHQGRGGYSRHPETLRWQGKLKALYNRHERLAREIQRRGYRHLSPLDKKLVKGKIQQDYYIDRPVRQKEILREKDCECLLK